MVGHATDLEIGFAGRVLGGRRSCASTGLTRQAMLIGQGSRSRLLGRAADWRRTPRSLAAGGRGAGELTAESPVCRCRGRVAEQHAGSSRRMCLAARDKRDRSLLATRAFGRGGHTAAIAAALGPAGRVVAIDRDRTPSGGGCGASRGIASHAGAGVVRPLDRERCGRQEWRRELDGVLAGTWGVSSPQLDDGQARLQFPCRTGRSTCGWTTKRAERGAVAGEGREREIGDVLRELGESGSRAAWRAQSWPPPVDPIVPTGQLAAIVARRCRRGSRANIPQRAPSRRSAST